MIMQWVPAHCGLPGNERMDALARGWRPIPTVAPSADRLGQHYLQGRRARRCARLAAELAGRMTLAAAVRTIQNRTAMLRQRLKGTQQQ